MSTSDSREKDGVRTGPTREKSTGYPLGRPQVFETEAIALVGRSKEWQSQAEEMYDM